MKRLVLVFGEPVFQRRFHLAMTLIFLAQLPVALLTGLKSSVPYLVFLSLWALVASHWSAFQTCRVEVKQDAQS